MGCSWLFQAITMALMKVKAMPPPMIIASTCGEEQILQWNQRTYTNPKKKYKLVKAMLNNGRVLFDLFGCCYRPCNSHPEWWLTCRVLAGLASYRFFLVINSESPYTSTLAKTRTDSRALPLGSYFRIKKCQSMMSGIMEGGYSMPSVISAYVLIVNK